MLTMTNPWKESVKSFGTIEELLNLASASAVFNKVVLDDKILPVEPLKCKVVEEVISQMDDISRMEDLLDKMTFEVQDLQFSMEYKDLLHSSEIEKKVNLLNDICEKIGAVLKQKRLMIDLLQQKGSSDALALHRNFHKSFIDFFKTAASLLTNLEQNLAIIEQAATMDPAEMRRHARTLMEQARRMQNFYAELDDISKEQ